jgi:hypothetical protein
MEGFVLGSYPAESIIEEVLCYHWLIHDSVPDICLDVVLSSMVCMDGMGFLHYVLMVYYQVSESIVGYFLYEV